MCTKAGVRTTTRALVMVWELKTVEKEEDYQETSDVFERCSFFLGTD